MFWFVLFSLLSTEPNAGAPPVLPRVRESVLDNLRRLPNYICSQTIERSYRNAASRPFGNIDRIRLEIGYIDGKEMFGWPGGERLAEDDVTRLVGGTITNGEFALAIRALFSGREVAFGDMKAENHAGRAALRFDFAVPRQSTDWILSIGGRRAPTGYHGSFWVDRDSLHLLELRITADDVPAQFGYATVTRDLQFESVRIGAGEFLLPSRAEFSATETSGAEDKNEARFHDCRQYTAESVISFGLSETGAPTQTGPRSATPAPSPAAALPDEFEASLTLDSPVDSDISAVGDPVTAHLGGSIKRKNQIAVPKGAILHGRIARLDVQEGRRHTDFAFTYFEVNGQRVEIGGRRNELLTLDQRSTIGRPLEAVPGPILANGSHLVLPRGFPFLLNSTAAAEH
jgi:hypothetical protein